ncbi:MAG: hypothetical protein ABGX43_07880 [Nitrospinaceae bacterium]|nr:hypothetical protein [Nitrospinaceae bacterium]
MADDYSKRVDDKEVWPLKAESIFCSLEKVAAQLSSFLRNIVRLGLVLFDDTFPDVTETVSVFNHQPVHFIEFDVGSSHEVHFFAFS